MGTPVRTARDAFDVVNGLEETASIKAKCYWDLMGIARYGTWPSSDHSRRRLCRLIAERGIVVADGCISVPSEPTLSSVSTGRRGRSSALTALRMAIQPHHLLRRRGEPMTNGAPPQPDEL